MSKRLFEHDPVRGLTTWWHPSEDGNSFSLEYVQDVEPIIESNKAKQSAGRAYYASNPDMWKVASIPVVIQYEWATKYGIKDVTAEEYWPKVQRLLNSSDYRWLKTAEVYV